jgi:predicted 2-oxoglutarate/Fe(II)-dependent dioxygenase YbiX
VSYSIGDRAPAITGATASGRFYSLDAQAGRPALVVALGAADGDTAVRVLELVRSAGALLAAHHIDLVPLAPISPGLAARFAADPAARDEVVHVAGAGGLETWTLEGRPAGLLIDRCGRIVDMAPLGDSAEFAAWLGRAAGRLVREPGQRRTSSAPVLIIPNVASPELCAALVEHFEASPHQAGVMAGFADGDAYAKLDETKKRRRDIELTASDAAYGQVLDLLTTRLVPEIKRAFQVEIATADRILIARYDDTGGYFKRHRDNAAPPTAFREFAVSLNLNTHEYDGGELLFPEFDDDRYSPPAGSAIIFSASLLHEAAPVLRGRRYVLLSFLCGAQAQARLDRWLASQAAPAA